jgi:hypothetical protein
VPIDAVLSESFTVATGQRILFHPSAEKVGTIGGPATITMYFGYDWNTYVDIPVAVTTDAVVNRSNVSGATASDANNNLNSRLLVVESVIEW